MNPDERDALINDYLDDELLPEDRPQIEARLRHDAAFRAAVEQQRALVAQAAALPRRIPAPASAWPNIVARIDEAKFVRPRFGRQPQRPWPRRIVVAAASLALIVLSSGVTAVLLRRPGVREATPVAAGSMVRTAADVEAAYALTIEDLRAALEARRDVLAEKTVAVIEANLAAIDQAIRQATAALSRDPQNDLVVRQLVGAYRLKVDVLARATELTAALWRTDLSPRWQAT